MKKYLFAICCFLQILHYGHAIFFLGLAAITIVAPQAAVVTGPMMSGMVGGPVGAGVAAGTAAVAGGTAAATATGSTVATGIAAGASSVTGSMIGLTAAAAPPLAIVAGTADPLSQDPNDWNCWHKLIHPTPEFSKLHPFGINFLDLLNNSNVDHYEIDDNNMWITNKFNETFHVGFYKVLNISTIFAHIY